MMKPSIGSVDGVEPGRTSLTTLLFNKYDVCPYCGGKYAD